MIFFVAASAISLVGLQASINAPRDAFKECLKSVSSKATNEKVAGDGFEAYARSACSGQLGSFKGAVVKFDMGNKMTKKASDEDADMMIADFMGSAVDNYKYRNGGGEKQVAAAPAPAATPATPTPTPAAAPQPPK
jgi:hypothetical protein